MRVIELLVDGQRVKLTTDENILRAVERGDLKPDSRVVITEHDEEVFVGEAIKDAALKAVFPAHMQPRAPQPMQVKKAQSQPVSAPKNTVSDYQSAQSELSKPATPSVPLTQSQKHAEVIQKYAQVATPEERKAANEYLVQPRPWRHWVGKVVDLNALVLGAMLVAQAIQSMNDPYGAGYLWLSVPAFFILDALTMRIFGGSPGKLLVNIQVRKNGKNIGVISGVKRSLASHIFGAGLWIPILSILTMLARYGSLNEKGRSEWDIKAGNAVIYGPIGFFRWCLIIVYFAFYALMILIGIADS